jgi:hypothetical protein
MLATITTEKNSSEGQLPKLALSRIKAAADKLPIRAH